MKHCFLKLVFLCIFCLTAPLFAQGAEPLKINNIFFDDSDGIVFLDTEGVIENNANVIKGTLKNPDRIYFDIQNAILTTPRKTYQAKNSVFNNIKVSQFSLEPKTVRMVFEYNKKLNPLKFNAYKTKNSIFLKTTDKLVSRGEFKNIYSNSKTAERTTYYNPASFFEEIPAFESEIIPVSTLTSSLVQTKKLSESKIPSEYYLDSVTKTKDGIILQGLGNISLIPTFELDNPSRLIIDLDDAVLNPSLRNKTFTFGELELTDAKEIQQRETLKLGQNSTSIVRLVIQGENSKDYRAVVSPEGDDLYITKKTNIINSKISDRISNLTSSNYSKTKDEEKISLSFDQAVSFSAFEQNSNLYFDVNNLNSFDNFLIENVIKFRPDIQIVRLALDKIRFVIPIKPSAEGVKKNVFIKRNPDSNKILITSKEVKIETKPPVEKKETRPIIAAVKPSERIPSISNLYVVVVDAGHGGSDVGATRNNIYEKDITLKIAKMVEKNLSSKKVKVYMIRTSDKTVSLAERSDFSNEKRPDLFVSIHVNSSLNDKIYGIETHWWKEDSINYAKAVHKELQKEMKNWKTNDRGLFKSQFYVINHTNAPAILVETGFISNPEERSQLTKTKRQEEIAKAISDGIYNYLRNKK